MTWLLLALTLGALAVIVWVSRERRDQRRRSGIAARRRSAEERLRARDERAAVRRVRDDDQAGR